MVSGYNSVINNVRLQIVIYAHTLVYIIQNRTEHVIKKLTMV